MQICFIIWNLGFSKINIIHIFEMYNKLDLFFPKTYRKISMQLNAIHRVAMQLVML